ncbi:unnamed protein product [Prorocentrum cordatum]|uniref:Uncharacterized protein n=1 Tax=Prorocentrum cordatum TaxID=2364126 RepID=A0ABN9T5V8_9DINO|nr:unnamed protein product [Polarella glacialis]
MIGDRAQGIGMDDDGDFVDGVVESAMRSLFPRLQADYQRELRSALHMAIRQSRGQPLATPSPERRPTAPSQPNPVAPPAPTVARALGQKAQALRKVGAVQEAAATPGSVTAPPGSAPRLFPIVEGGPPQDDLDQHLPGRVTLEQHSQRTTDWQASDGNPADEFEYYLPGETVTDVSDAGVGFALPTTAVSLPSGSRAATVTSRSFSPKSSTSPRKHRRTSFSLLADEDVEIIKRINKSEKEKLISPEAKCNPDWVFHQKKSNATTASKKRAFDIVTSRSFDYFMGLEFPLHRCGDIANSPWR